LLHVTKDVNNPDIIGQQIVTENINKSYDIDGDCIINSELNYEFLNDFHALDIITPLKDPNLPSAWSTYESFLKK